MLHPQHTPTLNTWLAPRRRKPAQRPVHPLLPTATLPSAQARPQLLPQPPAACGARNRAHRRLHRQPRRALGVPSACPRAASGSAPTSRHTTGRPLHDARRLCFREGQLSLRQPKAPAGRSLGHDSVPARTDGPPPAPLPAAQPRRAGADNPGGTR